LERMVRRRGSHKIQALEKESAVVRVCQAFLSSSAINLAKPNIERANPDQPYQNPKPLARPTEIPTPPRSRLTTKAQRRRAENRPARNRSRARRSLERMVRHRRTHKPDISKSTEYYTDKNPACPESVKTRCRPWLRKGRSHR